MNQRKEGDYDRRTIYISDKDDYEKWLKKMELEYEVIYNTPRRRLHDLMICYIQSNQEEFVDFVGENIEQ